MAPGEINLSSGGGGGFEVMTVGLGSVMAIQEIYHTYSISK